MLVRCIRGFAPAQGGPITEGSVFELPEGTDWLDAGLVVKAAPGEKPTGGGASAQNAMGKPHQALESNVRTILVSRGEDQRAPDFKKKVGDAVKTVLDKKAARKKRLAQA